MFKKFLIIAVIMSLAFSPLLHAPQAHAQTQKAIQQVVKRYGVYIGVTAAVAIVASVCAVVHTPLSSPVGDTCAAVHKGVSDFIDKHQTTFDKIEEFLKDTALQILKRRILDKLVDQIVQWIQGGGNPQFVSDWKGFLQDAGKSAAGDVISKTVPQLCAPFSAQVNFVLKIPGIVLPNLPVGNFKHGPASCTLDKVVQNIKNFDKDFRSGSWLAYQASWQPQNNFYGSLLFTIDAANTEAAKKVEAGKNEVASGGGFLSQKKCDYQILDPDGKALTAKRHAASESEIQKTKQNVEPVGDTVEVSNCQIVTPGSIAGGLVAKAVGSDFDFILNANDLSTYASAITNALVNRLIQEGSGGLAKIGKQSDPANEAYSSEDPNSVVTLPKDLIQGGECIIEDDPATPDIDESKDDPKTKDIKENEGVYIVNASTKEFSCLSLVPRGQSVLTAQNIARRKEMIDKYRQVLQHAEWLLLLKTKTKQHYTSLVRVVRTMNNLFKDRPGDPDNGPSDIKCKDGSDFHGAGGDGDYGTQFNFFKGMDLKFRLLGVKMAIIPSGEAHGEYQDILDTLDKDLENLPRLIDEVSNRLNVLQAPAGVIEERPFLHSVYVGVEPAPSTAGRFKLDLITPAPREAFDPIITPFHLYGDIGLGNLGQEIGKPVILEEPTAKTEAPSLIGIATGLNPNAPIQTTAPEMDGSDLTADEAKSLEVTDSPRSFTVPDIAPRPNVRRVTVSQKSLIGNRLSQLKSSFLKSSVFGVVGGLALDRQGVSSQQSSVQQAALQQVVLTSSQPALQQDPLVYGKTTLNDEQVDALHKSFIRFSLEHMALFTIYTNESHPAFELDLKQEEYRARALHYWLFTRNLYTVSEYNVGSGSRPVGRGRVVQDDLNEYLTIMSSTMDEINSGPTETGDRILADQRQEKRKAEQAALEGAVAGYIASGGNPVGAVVGAVSGFLGGGGGNSPPAPTNAIDKLTGGGLVGRTTVDLQTTPASEFLSDVQGTHRPAQYAKVGLFTWCTGYPIFNPELF